MRRVPTTARRLLRLAAVAAAASACGHAPEAAPSEPGRPLLGQAAPSWQAQTRVTGEYLVTLDAGAGATQIAQAYGGLGIQRLEDLGGGRYLLVVAQDPGPAQMEEIRARNPRIKAIQPNFVYRAYPGAR